LRSNTGGNSNTAFGNGALYNNIGGSENTGIGYNTNVFSGYLTNATAIGANTVVSQSNSLVLGNNADVGIGTSTPSAKLHVNGYTKLGLNAPAIQIKELSGTSAAAEGASITIAHGLVRSKIIGMSVLLNYGLGDVTAGFKATAGYEFNVAFDDTNIFIYNITANSANILSKPLKISITYKQ
jgi:hypothetical protein